MVELKERIARMIENDNGCAVNRTLRVVKSDLIAMLGEFMDVKTLDVDVKNGRDGYNITISVNAARIYNIGNTTEQK